MSKSIDDILALASRQSSAHVHSFYISSLKHAVAEFRNSPIAIQIVPVKLCAIIESGAREMIKRVIDSDAKYLSNGISYCSKLPSKSLVESIKHIALGNLTAGQLLSFAIPISSVSDITAAFSSILQIEDIYSELESITTKWTEDEDDTEHPIFPDFRHSIQMLNEMYNTRHFIAHEVSLKEAVFSKSIDTYISCSERFLEALSWIIVDRLHGRVPRTQTMMNITAGEQASKASSELDSLRGGSREKFAQRKTKYDELEYHWDEFAYLVASKYAGYLEEDSSGTIRPLLFATMYEKLLRWRIETLEGEGPWNPAARAK